MRKVHYNGISQYRNSIGKNIAKNDTECHYMKTKLDTELSPHWNYVLNNSITTLLYLRKGPIFLSLRILRVPGQVNALSVSVTHVVQVSGKFKLFWIIILSKMTLFVYALNTSKPFGLHKLNRGLLRVATQSGFLSWIVIYLGTNIAELVHILPSTFHYINIISLRIYLQVVQYIIRWKHVQNGVQSNHRNCHMTYSMGAPPRIRMTGQE